VNDIARVITKLEQQRATIDRAISALREVEGLKPAEAVSVDGTGTSKRKKRGMSAQARRRIGEATRRRWAEKRAAEAAHANKSSRSTKTARKAARKKRPARRTATPAAA
jgi:hypothetical protein